MDAHGLKEGLGGNLSHDEITVIRGALDLTHKTAADCMTPWDKVNAVGITCLEPFVVHYWSSCCCSSCEACSIDIDIIIYFYGLGGSASVPSMACGDCMQMQLLVAALC